MGAYRQEGEKDFDLDEAVQEGTRIPLALPIMCALLLTDEPGIPRLDLVAIIVGTCGDASAVPALVHLPFSKNSKYVLTRLLR